MIVVLHIVALCWFTLRRSYAIEVIPASYAWSTFTGPVSGEVQEVKPWNPSQQSGSSFSEFESANKDSNNYGPDYVAKPHYSFAYGVENPNTGDSHGHSETRDGSLVTGEYSVMEPDGVLRRVLYTADPKNGFRASVRYVRPDGEESSNRNHGYHSGGSDRLPGPPPHHQQQQQQSEFESDDGDGDDDESHPFGLQPQSLNQPSEYESEADEESFPPPLPRPQPLSSLNFGFNKYNDVNLNNNVGDDDDGDDYGGGGRPSAFKFPSPSSSFFKTPDAVNDSDDYGDGDKYYHWPGTLGSLQGASSPSPFGLPSSPSPSFGGTGGSVAASPTTPFVGFAKRTSPAQPLPCRPQPLPSHAPLSSEIVSYQTGHSNSLPLFVKSSGDSNRERFRSLVLKIGEGDDDEDDHSDHVENYESDDSDTENAHVADIVRLLPSAKSAPSRPNLTEQSSTSRPPSQTASATDRSSSAVAAPPPSFRLSPSSLDAHALELSPSPTMTPIQPTVIDIDV